MSSSYPLTGFSDNGINRRNHGFTSRSYCNSFSPYVCSNQLNPAECMKSCMSVPQIISCANSSFPEEIQCQRNCHLNNVGLSGCIDKCDISNMSTEEYAGCIDACLSFKELPNCLTACRNTAVDNINQCAFASNVDLDVRWISSDPLSFPFTITAQLDEEVTGDPILMSLVPSWHNIYPTSLSFNITRETLLNGGMTYLNVEDVRTGRLIMILLYRNSRGLPTVALFNPTTDDMSVEPINSTIPTVDQRPNDNINFVLTFESSTDVRLSFQDDSGQGHIIRHRYNTVDTNEISLTAGIQNLTSGLPWGVTPSTIPLSIVVSIPTLPTP